MHSAVKINNPVVPAPVLNLDVLGNPLTYRSAKSGPDASQWLEAETQEFIRLFDSHTMKPIHSHEQPRDRRKDTTYYNPQTKEKLSADGTRTFRIRGTLGGDRIHYRGRVDADTAEMELVKTMIQSVPADNAKDIPAEFMTIDLKDFYLGTPLARPEYVRIPIRMIPQAIIRKYNLAQ